MAKPSQTPDEKSRSTPALLALADGRVFRGTSIGAAGTTIGEVVFTTSMSGYQEVLSDPSYLGQIVTMTSAEIGNTGANVEDLESDGIKAAGLVVRSSRPLASNFRAEQGFRDFLRAQGTVAIEGVDTRALVLHVRTHGAQMGALSSEILDPETLIGRARAAGSMVGKDLAKDVTTKSAYDWATAPSALQRLEEIAAPASTSRPRIVAYDYGIKRSILRRLVEAGGDVRIVPATTSAADVLAMKPDGVFLSNGPGDPEPCTYAIESTRALAGRVPIFGICLGHQILGLALGAKSFKLKFGHRGSNQPVRVETTGRVRITSQNHGFAIDDDSLAKQRKDVVITEMNLNDQTLEAFEVPELRINAVQYHPEASPGPHDASDHFRRFILDCVNDRKR